jgi:uncharacterized protein (TIGR03067 family)
MANISYQVACPSCEANVPIRSSASIGKKIECPKCKYRFVVPEPAEDGADAGKKKGKDAVKKPAKKPAKSGGSKVLVGILLGVLAVAVLGVGGFFLFFGGDDSGTASNTNTRPSTPPPSGGAVTQPTPPGGDEVTGDPTAPMGTEGGTETGNVEKKAADPPPPPAGSGKDPTNLLPGDTRAVYRVNLDRLAQAATPIHTALFDRNIRDLFEKSFTFRTTDVATYIHCVVDPDSEPFAVIRTKTPFDEKSVLRLDLEQPKTRGGQVKKDYFLIKSNAFVDAASQAFGTRSLASLAGLPLPPAAPTRDPAAANKKYALCVYDNQTLFISTEGVMERFLSDLQDNGYPPFKSELTKDEAPPPPTTPGEGEGMPPGEGIVPGAPGGMPPGGREMSVPAGERVQQPLRPGPGGGGPLRPSGRGGPGIPSAPGAPGGPGAQGAPGQGNQAAPRRLFTSIPTYRTISPQLKRMLNELERDERNPPAIVYAELLGSRSVNSNPLLVNAIKTAGGDTLLALASQVRMAGLAVNQFNREKANAVLALEYVHDDDARKSVTEQIVPLLEKARPIADLLLGTQTTIRNTVGGQSGSPGGFFPGGLPGEGGLAAPGDPGEGDPRGGRFPGGAGRGGPPGMPSAPGGGFPGGGQPGGFPGFGQQPRTGSGQSSIEIELVDRIVSLKADVDWNEDKYASVVQTGISYLAGQMKGRMTVLTGEIDHHALAAAVVGLNRTKKPFPRGTLEREVSDERYRLPPPPDHRVSFFAELLPFLGKAGLRTQINDRKHAWFDKENLPAAEAWVPEFLVPYYPQDSWRATHPLAVHQREEPKGPGGFDAAPRPTGPATPVSLGGTNYVGLAGLGLDAARYDPSNPELAKRVGMTGYDWGSSPADVKDGMANTIYLIQTAPSQRPWIAGGGSTLVGVPDGDNPMEPFLHRRPDGKRGTYALMGDGSVRWIPEGTNPAVFKGMVTRAGSETLADLDKVAPVVPPPQKRDAELRGGGAGTGSKAPVKEKEAVDVEELKKFQGRWKMTLIKSKLIPKEILSQIEAEKIIEGTQVTSKVKTPKGEITVIQEIVRLDPKTSPKTMDVKIVEMKGPDGAPIPLPADVLGQGVYEFVGEGKLKTRSAEPGKPRPATVAMPDDESDDGYTEQERVK